MGNFLVSFCFVDAPFLAPWRRFLLRLFGARIAKTAMVYGSARIWYPPNVEMQEYACLGPGAICYSVAPITLVPMQWFPNGRIFVQDSSDFELAAKPIVIGAFAWIAAEAFVGAGVTVGEGAVLGARSVAFHDLPDWTIHIGNPAKYLRDRHKAVAVRRIAYPPAATA